MIGIYRSCTILHFNRVLGQLYLSGKVIETYYGT